MIIKSKKRITNIKSKKRGTNFRAPKRIYSHRIKDVMKIANLSQAELSDLIGTTPAHIGNILGGKRPCISLAVALKISEILKTPVEELFFLKRRNKKQFLINTKSNKNKNTIVVINFNMYKKNKK